MEPGGWSQKGVVRRCSIKVYRAQQEALRREHKFEEHDMSTEAGHEVFGEQAKKEKPRKKLRKRSECDLIQENVTDELAENEDLVFGDDYDDQKKSLEVARRLSIGKGKATVTSGPEFVTELAVANTCQEYAYAAEGDTQQNKVVRPLQLNEETCKPEAEDVIMYGEDIFSDDIFSDATSEVCNKRRKVTAVEEPPPTDVEKEEVINDEAMHEALVGKGSVGALQFLQMKGDIMGTGIGVETAFKRKKKLFSIDDDMPLMSTIYSTDDDMGTDIGVETAFKRKTKLLSIGDDMPLMSTMYSTDDDMAMISKEVLIEAQTPDLVLIGSSKSGVPEVGSLKREPYMDVSTFRNLLNNLGNIIQGIYNKDASSLSFMELFRTAYTLVMSGNASAVYNALKDTISEHLRKIERIVSAAEDDGLFLEDIERRWADYIEAAENIRVALGCLDKPGLQTVNMMPTNLLVLVLWRDIIVLSPNIQLRLQNSLLDLIYGERTGEKINRGLMRNMTTMLMELGSGVYETNFESPFIRESAWFYSRESQRLIECRDCGEYLKKAVRRFSEESERTAQYTHSTTAGKITCVLAEEFIAKHMQDLIDMENSGLQDILLDLFISDKRHELAMIYGLFKHVSNGHPTIRAVFSCHVKETGKFLLTDPERLSSPVDFIQHILNEKDRFDEIVSVSFSNDMGFQNTLCSSFEFINRNERSPEFLSLYLDNKLRKVAKVGNDEDVETTLDKVVILFRCLEEKDVFEKYYRQHLATRLLSGKSSDEAERSMLVKLKTECGSQYTSKLERMLIDMKTSHDSMLTFNSSPSSTIGGPTLSVQILTTGSWPIKPVDTCILPPEIVHVSQKFRGFYIGRHMGRRLSWQTAMGNADITATFGTRKHELNVSTYQMCVLMLFNSDDGLSYQDILEATSIPPVDLKLCLQSLACVKGKNVLRKQPLSKEISESDTFYFNDDFTSRLFKVKIGTVVGHKETEAETTETRHRVEEDRKPQIEAAIVRIMKSKKVLDHNSLVTEVTKQVRSRFLPDPMMIKKRIDSLIDRDFLERDKTDRKLYCYLA